MTEADLINFEIEGASISEAGVRLNVNVGIRYIASWLTGTGAAAINNLMEDATTAEISRSQVWQWLAQGASLRDGRTLTRGLYDEIVEQEVQSIREDVGEAAFEAGRYTLARQVFDHVATDAEFSDFLTLVAYEHIA